MRLHRTVCSERAGQWSIVVVALASTLPGGPVAAVQTGSQPTPAAAAQPSGTGQTAAGNQTRKRGKDDLPSLAAGRLRASRFHAPPGNRDGQGHRDQARQGAAASRNAGSHDSSTNVSNAGGAARPPRTSTPASQASSRRKVDDADGLDSSGPPSDLTGTPQPVGPMLGADSAGSIPLAPESGDRDQGDGADDGDGEKGEHEGEGDDEEEDGESGPWSLLAAPRLRARGVDLMGWWANGYIWNPDRPANRTNGPNGMHDRANDFLFNQLGLAAGRPLADEPDPWAIGWQCDLMLGSDARFVQSAGFDDSWVGGRYLAFAMPQLFADIHVPLADGTKVRIGRFWSPIGYEGVPSLDRFFYSATHAFMLAQPSTHTGILVCQPVGDRWTVQGGVVKGWDVWRDNNNSPGFLGTLGWTSDDESLTITHVIWQGDLEDAGGDRQTTYELIVTRDFSERLRFVGWYDFNRARGIATGPGGLPRNAQWLSINNALLYAINDRLSAGCRAEWFRDDDGVRIVDQADGSLLGPGNLFGITVGLNWTPSANWLVRPELRWDGASDLLPFDDRTSARQWTAGCDVVLRF